MSPALAGGFPTTAPPGKPPATFFMLLVHLPSPNPRRVTGRPRCKDTVSSVWQHLSPGTRSDFDLAPLSNKYAEKDSRLVSDLGTSKCWPDSSWSQASLCCSGPEGSATCLHVLATGPQACPCFQSTVSSSSDRSFPSFFASRWGFKAHSPAHPGGFPFSSGSP